MKVFLFLVSLVFVLASSHAETKRVYSTYYGDVDLEALEQIISERIKADVQDLSMRGSYNPLAKMYNLAVDDKVYVVQFSVNKIHHIDCDFMLVAERNAVIIHSCYSETAEVDVFGYIEITDIGLKTITEPKAQFN